MTDLWTIGAAQFRRWSWAAANLERGDDEAAASCVLHGQAGDDRYYTLTLEDDASIGVYARGADTARHGDFFWEVGPDGAYRDSNTGGPSPAEMSAALTRFVPFPRHDELFAYRPGDDVVALQMWRTIDDNGQDAPFIAPGVRREGPTPPLYGALLTQPGRQAWPAELQGAGWPALFWELFDAGLMVPIGDLIEPEQAPTWLSSVDPYNEGAIDWTGPTGPGLPDRGIYRSRINGEPPADVQWTRTSLTQWMRDSREDRTIVEQMAADLPEVPACVP